MQAPKHGSGTEKIPRKQIKFGIPHHITEDVEDFIVVRFWKKCPMIGYIQKGVYYIVWLDREHVAY